MYFSNLINNCHILVLNLTAISVVAHLMNFVHIWQRCTVRKNRVVFRRFYPSPRCVPPLHPTFNSKPTPHSVCCPGRHKLFVMNLSTSYFHLALLNFVDLPSLVFVFGWCHVVDRCVCKVDAMLPVKLKILVFHIT